MMLLTREILNNHIHANGWLGELETLIAEIEANVELEPDISIESCKSLLESIAKNILLRLDTSHDERSINDLEIPRLLKEVRIKLTERIECESTLIERYSSALQYVAELRNSRGEISHGKTLPKSERSTIQAAKSIKSFTDGFASYLLHLLLSIEPPPPEQIPYEDNEDFNTSLDETYRLGIISYSKALYEQDYIADEEELENYKNELTLDEE
jgi:hypothetical protein